MIVRILMLWACNTVALFVADWLFDGLDFESAGRVVVAGAVLGVVIWLVNSILHSVFGLDDRRNRRRRARASHSSSG